MLIRFRVSNYLSFDQEVELSMIPGRVRSHSHHIVKEKKRSDINIMRAAIIYGANASGKSNLIKAMHFARALILKGTRGKEALPRNSFKLSQEAGTRPSKFEFEFKQGDVYYAYGFKIGNRRVHEEWLYKITKSSERLLFERDTSPAGETRVQFGRIKLSNKKEANFLDFVAMGTRPNQLFLTECIERDVKQFESIYRWFDETLVIIFPDSVYPGLSAVSVATDFEKLMATYLEQLGTGICGFDLKKVNPEAEFPDPMQADILKEVVDSPKYVFVTGPEGSRYLIEYHDEGTYTASKLMFRHKMLDCGGETLLDMTEESDGTKRLMDLLPTFARIVQEDRVIIVDELDRSLHPKLSHQLIQLFLENTSRSDQLIATTHEENLLDLGLLRRDEIWFIEKDPSGASHLYSLEEFAPRHDENVKRGYLMGRFGAIPVFGDLESAQ